MMELEEFVKVTTLSLGSVVEGMAALLIGHAIVQAGLRYARNLFIPSQEITVIRLDLGKSLAIALEFLLAADILRTAVAPNWDDIGKLAAIAILRTLLNYFLEREIKSSENRIL